MTDTTSVTARVRVTLDIRVPSCWNKTTQMDQIIDQAKTDALGALSRVIQNRELSATIVGTPVVTAVFAKEAGL